MMAKQIMTLEDVRNEKDVARRKINSSMTRLRNDVNDCFMPSNSLFVNSSNKYMNYIGYVITAYKTAMNVKGVYKFFAKLF